MTIVPARPTGACQTNCGTGAGRSDNGDGYSTLPDETVVYDGLLSDESQLATMPIDERVWWVR